MKKIIALLLTSVILLSLCSCSKKTEGEVIDDIPNDTTSVPEENTDFSITEEQQIELYKKKIYDSIESSRNEYGIDISGNFCALYDIDGDGILEMLIKDGSERGKGNIGFNRICAIINGKVTDTDLWMPLESSWGNNCEAEVFENGIIAAGGSNEDGDSEFFSYYILKNGVLNSVLFLKHIYPDSNGAGESWEYQRIESNGKNIEKTITKDEYEAEKARVEINPVTDNLEWKSFKEFV